MKRLGLIALVALVAGAVALPLAGAWPWSSEPKATEVEPVSKHAGRMALIHLGTPDEIAADHDKILACYYSRDKFFSALYVPVGTGDAVDGLPMDRFYGVPEDGVLVDERAKVVYDVAFIVGGTAADGKRLIEQLGKVGEVVTKSKLPKPEKDGEG